MFLAFLHSTSNFFSFMFCTFRLYAFVGGTAKRNCEVMIKKKSCFFHPFATTRTQVCKSNKLATQNTSKASRFKIRKRATNETVDILLVRLERCYLLLHCNIKYCASRCLRVWVNGKYSTIHIFYLFFILICEMLVYVRLPATTKSSPCTNQVFS